MKFGEAGPNRAVDECFRPAVKRTGFELRLISDKQPAGLIDNQLRAAILASRFVISDLTHGSPGAYWEAGYGEGLGLPVIYTCEKAAWQKQKTHFDTNHLKTIIWDPENLEHAGEGLTATIRATLRADAKQTDD
jgi:nucleoside 2-deoxyribosyltransferase